jgi:hypothetical protein
MNFPYVPPLKFHSLTLVYVLSSLSALLKLLQVLYPLKSIHVIKCLHRNTDSQNLIFPIALWTYWCLSSSRSPWNFHSSLTPFLPFLHKLFFSHIFLICFLVPWNFVEGLCHHRRQVHVYRFRAHSTIHSSLSWTQVVDFHLIIEDRVGNVGLSCKHVLLVQSRLHYCHDSCFTSRCFLFADFTQCQCLALWQRSFWASHLYLVTWVTMIKVAWGFEGEGSYMDGGK